MAATEGAALPEAAVPLKGIDRGSFEIERTNVGVTHAHEPLRPDRRYFASVTIVYRWGTGDGQTAHGWKYLVRYAETRRMAAARLLVAVADFMR